MSSSNFQILQHTISGQHIREFPNATRNQEDVALKVHIKQYKPLNNLTPAEDSITIIGLHANGFPKETYEPLWDELLDKATSIGLKIRSIWIADASHQGASGVLNEDVQGEDASYFDLSRDLLHMVNVFREEMVAPIFGIGHSMGAAQLAYLSYLHPRLFHSIALVEPVIQASFPAGPNPSMFAAFRPDLFPDKATAESGLRFHPMFKAIDDRVLKRYADVAFRELPTRLYPDIPQAKAILKKAADKAKAKGSPLPATPADAAPVTLTTTKHQEAWSYTRGIFAPLPSPSDPSSARTERLISPDLDPHHDGGFVFMRPELLHIFTRLPELRPATLWLYGETSFINTPEIIAQKGSTGTGRGGSGGLKSGRVKEVTVPETGHMLPFEQPGTVGRILAGWLADRAEEWRDERVFMRGYDTGRSEEGEGVKMSGRYREAVMDDVEVRRERREKL